MELEPLTKPSFYDLSLEQLKKCLIQNDFKEFVASDLYNWHYKKRTQPNQQRDKLCSVVWAKQTIILAKRIKEKEGR